MIPPKVMAVIPSCRTPADWKSATIVVEASDAELVTGVVMAARFTPKPVPPVLHPALVAPVTWTRFRGRVVALVPPV